MKQTLKYPPHTTQGRWLKTKAPKLTEFYSSHIHNDYEILFFYDGDADYIIGGSLYHLQKNDLLLIKPAVYHNLRILSPHPYERVVCNFQEDVILPELIPFLHEADNLYSIEANSPIKRIFDTIRDVADVFPQEDFLYLLNTSLNQVILHLKHHSSRTAKEKIVSRSTLEKILLYIDENLALPLTIAHLSETFNLSQSWIAHSFKKTMGISPSQYINRKKIIYAQSLINMGVSPVRVAELCGYVNYTTFYRQYKKYLGISPAQDKQSERHQGPKE